MSLKTFFASLRAATGGKVETRTDSPAVDEDDVLETLFRAQAPVVTDVKGSARILLDSLRLADDGKVECRVEAPDGSVVQGVIEQTFFEEFMTSPTDQIDGPRKGRIIQQNIEYLETQAERLWHAGSRELVIK